MIRVCLDNMIASALVTSNVSLQEQSRTKNPDVRAALAAHADDVARVTHDHRLLGFNNVDSGHLGYISSLSSATS